MLGTVGSFLGAPPKDAGLEGIYSICNSIQGLQHKLILVSELQVNCTLKNSVNLLEVALTSVVFPSMIDPPPDFKHLKLHCEEESD